MKKSTQKIKFFKKSERGSALLLTLGLLAMLLVMGMAFAFSSRTRKQRAQVAADNIKAKLLTQSALDTTLAFLKDNATARDIISGNEALPLSQLYDNATTQPYNIGGMDVSVEIEENDSGTNATIKGASEKQQADYILHEEVNFLTNVINVQNADSNPLFDSSGTGWNASTAFGNLDKLQRMGFYTTYDDNHKVSGRYHAFIINNTGKFDLNALLVATADEKYVPFVKENKVIDTTRSDDSTSSEEYYYNIYGDYEFEGTYSKKLRLGLSPREIILDNSSTLASDLPWLSYSQMWEKLGTSIPKFVDNYTYFSPLEPEAYWDGTREIQRFDLTGYEWRQRQDEGGASIDKYYKSNHVPSGKYNWESNSSNYADRQKYARQLALTLAGCNGRANFWNNSHTAGKYEIDNVEETPDAFDEDDNPANNNLGIHYLYGKKQIAANMVDYCDSDDNATLLFNGTNTTFDPLDDSKMPEFVGNEKVFYINELAFKTTAKCEKIDTENNAEGFIKKYTITLKYWNMAELVNIYLSDSKIPAGECDVYVFGSATCEISNGTGSTEMKKCALDNMLPWSSTNPIKFHYDFSAKEKANLGYIHDDSPVVDLYAGTISGLQNSNTPPVVNFNVKISKVVALTYKEGTSPQEIYDLAEWRGASENAIFSSVGKQSWMASEGGTFSAIASIEASDPRLNYRYQSVDTGGGAAITETSCPMVMRYFTSQYFLDSDNDNYEQNGKTPSGDNTILLTEGDGETMDKESGITFTANKTYSTAFIRNAPFEGLWELGLIHRGSIGQTINLAKFTDSLTMDNYDAGDAAILGQVKIGPARFSRGKFNINSWNQNSYETLLTDVYLDLDDERSLKMPSDVTDFYTGQFDAEYDPDSDELPDGSPETFFDNRGALATRLELVTANIPSEDDDDLHRETIIGRTAQLTGARYETLTVVILAQAMREMDGNISKETYVAMKELLVNPTAYATIREQSGSGSCLATGRDIHYCSILSTQILVATVLHDTWHNTFTVVQTEYL